MEFNKIKNLLGPAHDKVPRFITKKWIEVQSKSGSTYSTSKPIRFKLQCLDLIYVIILMLMFG